MPDFSALATVTTLRPARSLQFPSVFAELTPKLYQARSLSRLGRAGTNYRYEVLPQVIFVAIAQAHLSRSAQTDRVVALALGFET